MIFQIVNRSIISLYDIIEDVIVKVDKFIFLMDFVILDMETNKEVPIIHGGSFLATNKPFIDFK